MGHFGYKNRTILVILSVHVARMLLGKFQLNQLCMFKDVEGSFSKGLVWQYFLLS